MLLMPTKKKSTKTSFLKKTYTRPLVIILIAVIVIVGWKLYENHRQDTLKTSPYTSTKYNFTINFPGKPVTTSQTQTEQGTTATETQILSDNINGQDESFEVNAINLPPIYKSLTKTHENTVLALLLETTATDIFGTNNISNTQSTFQGHTSENIQFTTTKFGPKLHGYAVGFITNNTEYLIWAVGSTKNNYNDFANSFKYITR